MANYRAAVDAAAKKHKTVAKSLEAAVTQICDNAQILIDEQQAAVDDLRKNVKGLVASVLAGTDAQ